MTTEPRTRLIRASADLPDLLEQWGARSDDGRRITAEWGEPDADGIYKPVFTTTDDGWLAAIRAESFAAGRAAAPDSIDAAWAAVEAVLPEGTWLYLAKTSKGRYGAQIRGRHRTGASGENPAAALLALAGKLRLAHPAEAEEKPDAV